MATGSHRSKDLVGSVGSTSLDGTGDPSSVSLSILTVSTLPQLNWHPRYLRVDIKTALYKYNLLVIIFRFARVVVPDAGLTKLDFCSPNHKITTPTCISLLSPTFISL